MPRKISSSEAPKSKRKRSLKLSQQGAYVAAFLLIIGLVYTGQNSNSVINSQRQSRNSQQALPGEAVAKPSIDQLAATELAATLAANVDLPVATNVRNQAISLSARNVLSQVSDDTIVKPQSTQAANSSSHDVTVYKTKPGDTVDTVAAQFKLAKDTIRWSNNIQGDALEPNRDLLIPPVDGLIASAQAGDTVSSLAQKYGTSAERVLLFNDVDASGVITAGTQVVIPGGQVAAAPTPTPAVAVSRGGASTVVNYTNLTATGNGYDYGYCTWYAFNRRAALGRPIGGMWGNASSWATLARMSGFLVNSTPDVGAVMQTAYAAGGYGHVAVVESVNPDGSILVSEMNYAGWNRKSVRTIAASDVASYNYIH